MIAVSYAERFLAPFDAAPAYPRLPHVRLSQRGPPAPDLKVRSLPRSCWAWCYRDCVRIVRATPIPPRATASCAYRGQHRVAPACSPRPPVLDQAMSRACAELLCVFHPVPRSASRKRSRFCSFGRRLRDGQRRLRVVIARSAPTRDADGASRELSLKTAG